MEEILQMLNNIHKAILPSFLQIQKIDLWPNERVHRSIACCYRLEGLLDAKDGIFFHTARRRDNYKINHLVAQQRSTHWRLIRY
jgi:hypothetical protein